MSKDTASTSTRLEPMVMPLRHGRRKFLCEKCGRKWESASRDMFSRSGENCRMCETWCMPYGQRMDEHLSVSDSGNLIGNCFDVVEFGGDSTACDF
jgi:hypothetical protein